MPTTYTHRARTTAHPDQVWSALQDPATWAKVAGVDSTSNHRLTEGRLAAFDFSTAIGGLNYRGSARVTEAHPGRAMALSIRSNEVSGTIEVALHGDEDGTDLDVSMRITPNGLLGSMVFPVVSSALSNGFPESVDRLAASLD